MVCPIQEVVMRRLLIAVLILLMASPVVINFHGRFSRA
jgi:hypothetical protein